MILPALRSILVRDLTGLRREIAAYPDDASVWQIVPGISNSAGNLALHAAGNIQHFVGAVLGGSGYVRDREGEFSRTGVPRDVLDQELSAAVRTVEVTFPNLTAEQLQRVYPLPIAERRVKTGDFLVHLAAHLGYHLGQVDYHRRILTHGEAVETVSPRALPSQPVSER